MHIAATARPAPRTAPAILAWLKLCFARRRQRRMLAELDPTRLADLGLDAADIARESAKPCWLP